ncbi:MAG: hypothetical protein V7L26_05075 [Nostoc sp.]|jgi:hypothetical protein|uniref:hypothetical protein n=1 Tax=Nostoc sp. TaxID=1180 RepID=UPI002FEF4C63
MAKQPRNKFEQIAAQMVKAAGYSVEYGEYEFVSTATRLIEPLVVQWYAAAEIPPPVTGTIERWFYNRPPAWAIAFLANEKEKFLTP